VVLRGVNVPSLDWSFVGENVVRSVTVALNDWHANLIRLQVNQDFWFGHDEAWPFDTDPHDGGASYRGLVDRLVSTARASNAYVMLDLQSSDLGVWGANNGQHDLPDDHSILFWQDAARHYANNEAVLFDPFNEPHQVNWGQWHDGAWLTEGGRTYFGHGLQEVLNTIRATGARNLVAPEGVNWGDDYRGIAGHYLADPAGNLAYQAHLYPGSAQVDAERDARVAGVAGYPLYVGEWGADPWGGDFGTAQPDAPTWAQRMLAWLNQHQYSWTAWSLHPGATPCLISDWDYTPTAYAGAYVKADLAAHQANPTADYVVGQFNGAGVWRYSSVSGWQQLTPNNATAVASDDRGDVAGAFPGQGVWRYRDGTGWRQLSGFAASQVSIAGSGTVAADFPGYGVYRWEDATGWQQLTANRPSALAVDPSGDVAGEFPGQGVWLCRDATGWRQLASNDAAQVSAAGDGVVAAAFAGQGVWRYRDGTGWVRLTAADATAVAVDASGDVAADMPGYGVCRYGGGAGWQVLATNHASQLCLDASGEVAAEFAGAGVWRYRDGTGWRQLTGNDASLLDA
jgi:hypothetical protein